jgi:SUMO ligase MMS21 Smc5/6 complex component
MKSIARLLQLISLDGYGKKILFHENNLHRDLIGVVTQCQDPMSLEYIINTLGQISSSKTFKLVLIEEDIVEVCMGILRSNKYENNENILENSVAILLNMA